MPSSLYFSTSAAAEPDSPKISCIPSFLTGVGSFSLKTSHTAEIKLITANTELKAKNDAYKELLAEKDRYSRLVEQIKYDRAEKVLDNLENK